MPRESGRGVDAALPDHIAGRSTGHPRTASVCQWLTDMLAGLGATMAFGVPGGPIAPLVDALSQGVLRVIHTRHESSAVFCAMEASLVLRAPQVVFVTTGPGLYNALNGIAAAQWEGAHVVLLSGATSPHHCGRLAAQETSPMTMLQSGIYTGGPLFDYAVELRSPAQLPHIAARLFEGFRRPQGFVAHVALPVSVQSAEAPARCLATKGELFDRGVDPALLDECAARLARAPFVVWVGFGARHAAAEIRLLVEKTGCRVLCSPHAKGIFPESHPNYIGMTGLGGYASVDGAFEESRPQTILVLGSRLAESTSYWDPKIRPSEGFIHVDLDRNAFCTAFPDIPTWGVVAEVRHFLQALLLRWPGSFVPSRINGGGCGPPARIEAEGNRLIRPEFLMQTIGDVCIDAHDALIMAEAGNSFAWCSHYLRFQKPNRYRISPHYGSMGHFVAGAVGAAMARNGKAVAVVGDGAMLMLNEITTAVKHRVQAVWIVLNDSEYGSVKHGMRALGYEPPDTTLPAVDFAAFAKAQGAYGRRVEDETECSAALEDVMRATGPAVLDVVIDPTRPSPLLQRIRSLQAQGAMPPEKDSEP
jgi:acetolactate synthase I/II/III large subunit